ncbi:MAG TPA: crossover junction endodeoxyribonuclease RuvC [Methanoregula sp.]|nr:crossover junction endodeoxyribonuclease RuvC [Methanoregula sp.]
MFHPVWDREPIPAYEPGVVIPATDLVEADLPVNIFKDEMGRGATESVAARILKRKPGKSLLEPESAAHFHHAHHLAYKQMNDNYLIRSVWHMIVIGIDPGLARVGYGVIEVRNRKPEPVCCGCIETSMDQSTSGRLVHIYTEVAALLEKYPPAHMAVEKLFFTRNITSAMSVSEARGVILLLAEQKKIPVTEYTPNQVKQAITGSGRADKRQMQEMIMRLLHLPEIPRPDDAADALSIALCHIHILR